MNNSLLLVSMLTADDVLYEKAQKEVSSIHLKDYEKWMKV